MHVNISVNVIPHFLCTNVAAALRYYSKKCKGEHVELSFNYNLKTRGSDLGKTRHVTYFTLLKEGVNLVMMIRHLIPHRVNKSSAVQVLPLDAYNPVQLT